MEGTMWLLLGSVLAGPMPEGLDLEDIDAWEARALALADGPQGCWSLRGEFETRGAIYIPSSFFSQPDSDTRSVQGTFEGTIVDGEWTRFVYSVPLAADASKDALDASNKIRLRPIVGIFKSSVMTRNPDDIPPSLAVEEASEEGEDAGVSVTVEEGDESDEEGDASRERSNLLRASVEDWWDSSISTSYMRWDAERDGAVMVMEVPVSDSRRAEAVMLSAFFPGGGLIATQIDSILPHRLPVGDGIIKGKVMNGQLHLQGRVIGGLLLPTSESWSAVFGFLGFTWGYEQRIAYTSAQECS
jgi:hypothetical protein